MSLRTLFYQVLFYGDPISVCSVMWSSIGVCILQESEVPRVYQERSYGIPSLPGGGRSSSPLKIPVEIETRLYLDKLIRRPVCAIGLHVSSPSEQGTKCQLRLTMGKGFCSATAWVGSTIGGIMGVSKAMGDRDARCEFNHRGVQLWVQPWEDKFHPRKV